jgi:hypothetical protein
LKDDCRDVFNNSTNAVPPANSVGIGRKSFPWSADEETVARTFASNANNSERTAQGLQIKIDGYDHWIMLEFSSGKFISLHERFNFRGVTTSFLSALKARYGETAQIGTEGNECTATWVTEGTVVRGQWQPSEWYFEIDYSPEGGGQEQFPIERQMAVWAAYIAAEGRLGKDAALRSTSKEFNLSQDDVFRIVVSGIENSWPTSDGTSGLRAGEASPPTTLVDRSGEAARKSLPSGDRRAYDELRSRSYSEEQAREAAAALRRLCEAGKGRDCK